MKKAILILLIINTLLLGYLVFHIVAFFGPLPVCFQPELNDPLPSDLPEDFWEGYEPELENL